MKQLQSGRVLATCGMCIALAAVTSFIKVFSLPMGGSVTLLSMFFITIIGYMYGLKVSIPAAIAYGLVQFILKPEMYTPVQVIVDYFCAFGALGLSGAVCMKNNTNLREMPTDSFEDSHTTHKDFTCLILGYLIGVTGRFVFATISGVIFWGEYAWDGWNPVLYSICYNGMYIYAEAIVTIAILFIPAVRSAIVRVTSSLKM